MEKPSLDEFLKYAERTAKSFIAKKYSSIPFEIKEECVQEAMVRVLDVYKNKLDEDRKWKGYCGTHAIGAVQDYLRKGSSFEEDKWSLQADSASVNKRLSTTNYATSEVEEVSGVLGRNGVFNDHESEEYQINWGLLSRLASKDNNVKILAKHLLGFKNEEIKKEFGLTGERIGQIIADMFERIKSPSKLDLLYSQFRQLLFSLGMPSHLDYEFKDEGVGWSFEPVDLFENYSQSEEQPQSENLIFDL